MPIRNPGPAKPPLPFEEFERAYEKLAEAIDAAGPEREALFLTRLALMLAHEAGDLALFEKALSTALDDL
jgi:hypothetical protein